MFPDLFFCHFEIILDVLAGDGWGPKVDFGYPGGSTFGGFRTTWDDRDQNLKSTIIERNMSQFQVIFSRPGGSKK